MRDSEVLANLREAKAHKYDSTYRKPTNAAPKYEKGPWGPLNALLFFYTSENTELNMGSEL